MTDSKTNAMRLLDRARIPYQTHAYDPENGIDGLSVARSLGQEPQRVFKTLVAQGKSRAFYVFILPVAETLDLKAAATACGEKAVALIPQKLLLPTTGYVHGGCSPFAMKKAFPTVLDASAAAHPTICVSAGRIGLQLELSPEDLLRLTKGTLAQLAG